MREIGCQIKRSHAGLSTFRLSLAVPMLLLVACRVLHAATPVGLGIYLARSIPPSQQIPITPEELRRRLLDKKSQEDLKPVWENLGLTAFSDDFAYCGYCTVEIRMTRHTESPVAVVRYYQEGTRFARF